MNEQELTRGLTALADQTPHLSVDVDSAIMTAVSRAKRNRIVTAAAFSTTVVLAGAITFVTLNGATAPPDLNPAAAPTKTPPTAPRQTGNLSETPTRTMPNVSPAKLRKQQEFSDHLKAVIPGVVPGVITAEQTWDIGGNDGITNNFAVLDKASGDFHSHLEVRVFNAATAAQGSNRVPVPGGHCKEITKPEEQENEPVCYRQADRSLVYLINVRGTRPGDVNTSQWRVATHVRNDGSVAAVTSLPAELGSYKFSALTDQQLIKLATDPFFTFK